MRKALLILLLASVAGAQDPGPKDSVFTFPFPDCGLVTRYAPNRIGPNCIQDVNNLILDEDLTISRRSGQSKYNASAAQDAKSVRGLWPFTTTAGAKYLVALSSMTMWYSTGDGTLNLIAGATNWSLTAGVNCVQSLGKFYCVNGSQYMMSWDGTSTHTIMGAPLGTLIGKFRNRLIMGNISGSLSRIRLSGELDGTDWTVQVPGRSTTPANIDIAGLNDGKPVTCLLGEYQNAYYIGRENELYALYGNDRRDFTLRQISAEVGCTEPLSVREKNNALYWVSKRGVEKMAGTTRDRVSDTIRPTIETIIAAGGNLVTAMDTAQADWQAGNVAASGPGARVDASLYPNNVVPSTWSAVFESTSDYAVGTFFQTTFYNYASVKLLASTTNEFLLDNFQGSVLTSSQPWNDPTNGYWAVGSGSSGGHDALACRTGPGGSGGAADAYAIYIASGVVAAGKWGIKIYWGPAHSATAKSFRYKFIDMGDGTGSGYAIEATAARLNLVRDDSGVDTILGNYLATFDGGATSTQTFWVTRSTNGEFETSHYATWATSATDNTYWPNSYIIRADVEQSGTGCNGPSMGIDTITYSGFAYGGVYFSKTFDVGYTTPTAGPLIISSDVPTGTSLSFQTRDSADGSTWGPWGTFTNSHVPASASFNARYVQFLSSFTTSIGTVTPSFTTANLYAATTGYFISQCHNPGSGITAWDSMKCNYATNGGDFTFYIATGTTCSMVTRTTATWNTQQINSAISVPTGTYVAYRALFDFASSTNVPTLYDCSISWNEGGQRPNVIGEVYKDRYYLFYTTSTASGAYNDHALVLDSNDKWTKYDNVNAAAATIYNNKFYTGSSVANGFVFLQDFGQNDNGSAFTFHYHTPDMDMGNPSQLKIFKTLYIDLKGPTEPAQDISLDVSYNIDGSTTTYSLGSVNLNEAAESSGYFTARLPFPKTQKVDGSWISFKFDYTGQDGPLKLYGMRMIYENMGWK